MNLHKEYTDVHYFILSFFSIDLRLFDIKIGGKDGEVGGRFNRGAYMT